MTCCVVVDVGGILSPSLRRLSITRCDFHRSTRCRISAPRLTSLQLVVFYGRAPFLEEMPLLVNGNVRLEDCSCADICKNKRYYGDCGDDNCRGCFGSRGDGSSVLLQRLSSATDLKLTSYPNVFIFRKDFMFCTTFSDLKTLLFNEWCLKPGFGALDYFLRNSPVMEKLTIQLENCFLQVW
ncbi:hypothetical protein HU200_016713 [Digitaria exilis]|uniref:Uncharacterized protein n=1 Tax=Digitaria exilis TaxID=1010633 RepID=A0A835F7L7_9POAL|nr:hypothetical protein HU200_016713 [Digitaria exilis]